MEQFNICSHLGETGNLVPLKFLHGCKVGVSSKVNISFMNILYYYYFLLVLFILSNGPEEIGELLIISIGDGSLCTVADDQGPVVFGHSSYWLHRVRTGRT